MKIQHIYLNADRTEWVRGRTRTVADTDVRPLTGVGVRDLFPAVTGPKPTLAVRGAPCAPGAPPAWGLAVPA